MSPTMVRLVSLTRREVSRFMKIPRQTLGAPLLETFLYISIFGAALGSRVGDLDGVSYVGFVIPGLIMMAFAINAFSNNSSSILQQKFQRAIDDQLSSPASPAQLLLAFTLGGFLRGLHRQRRRWPVLRPRCCPSRTRPSPTSTRSTT